MFNPIGSGRGIGGPLRHAIPGESFIRHIGNDKLIFDFHEGSGTTVHDKSHNSNDGTFGAGAAAPTWKRNSLYFDGVNDYIDVLVDGRGQFDNQKYTICFTGSRNVVDNDQAVFSYDFTSHVNPYYACSLIFVSTDNTRGSWNDGSNVVNLQSDILDTTPFVDYSDCFTYESGRQFLYRDGIPIKSATETDTITFFAQEVWIGASPNTSRFYYGIMKNIRVLSKGLSGIECQQEYLSQKFRGNN